MGAPVNLFACTVWLSLSALAHRRVFQKVSSDADAARRLLRKLGRNGP